MKSTIITLLCLLLGMQVTAQDDLLKKSNLKILNIGNSYTIDVTYYLKDIVAVSGTSTSEMCIYRMYRSNASFKEWVDIYNDEDIYEYYYGKVLGGISANTKNATGSAHDGSLFRQVITDDQWDIIFIHPSSTYAPYYDDWGGTGKGGYLNELLAILHEHQPNAKIGFIFQHSYWDGYVHNDQRDSYLRWQLIAQSTQQFVEDYNIEYLIPYGTAIENLRNSSLNNDYDLTRDGTQLCYGLGRYAAACCYYEAVIAPRSGKSILGNTARFDVSETSSKYPPINVTDENATIAQKAAILAVNNPYALSNPEETVNPNPEDPNPDDPNPDDPNPDDPNPDDPNPNPDDPNPDDPDPQPEVLITFVDSHVKELCVAAWDTNGDGELSNLEAAAVTDLGTTFAGDNKVLKFDELQYFTGLKTIAPGAFKKSQYMTNITLPEQVETIGEEAFYGCYKLVNLTLPEGQLTTIADNAFYACTGLKSVCIPEGVTTLGTKSFYYCTRLTDVSLPSTLTAIGSYGFRSCKELVEVTANMETPFGLDANTFPETTYTDGTLHVPAGKAEAYSNTAYWSKFVNIEAPEVIEPEQPEATLVINNTSVLVDKNTVFEIGLENNLPLVSFQLDLELPIGATITDIDFLPFNVPDFQLYLNDIGTTANTRQYRIIGYSPTNTPTLPNVEDFLALSLYIDKESTGLFTSAVTNAVYVDSELNRIPLDDITATFEILPRESAGVGDVNVDGEVNVLDIAMLVNHVIGWEDNGFAAENADINGDGFIDVADISHLAQRILSELPADAPQHIVAHTEKPTFSLTEGEAIGLVIPNGEQFVAGQADIILSEGQVLESAVAATGHTVSFMETAPGRYRLIAFSMVNAPFSATAPQISLTVSGEGQVTVTNSFFCTADNTGVSLGTASLYHGGETGVAEIGTTPEKAGEVYTIDGRLLMREANTNGMAPGIYIIEGKKIVVR